QQSVRTSDGAWYVTEASDSACCWTNSAPQVFIATSPPSPYVVVHSEGFSVVASTPVSMMFQSTPYAAATPFTLLNAVPCVETAPYAPDVRLMMLSAVAVPKTIAWSPDAFLYATARSVTAAPAVTTATSAAYVAPLSVLSRILMPVPATSAYTT